MEDYKTKYQKDIKIILSQKLLEQLKKCVVSASPNEACGLIFGDIKSIELNNSGQYQYHYIGQNFKCFESDRKSPVAFLIENFEEFNRVFKQAHNEFNLKLISIFHSHPAGSHPSGVDLGHMKFLDTCGLKNFKYLVWTIMDATNSNLNGFIYFKEELMQVEVERIKE